MAKTYATVLIIAGSDTIGGAGIQADIKTCTVLGAYATTSITALTAQNTTGVQAIQPVGVDFLRKQLKSILTDITPDAVKIGMIPDKESAIAIADAIDGYRLKNIIVDPVMVATSGDSLSSPATLDIMRNRIFGKALFITPNLPEAETILGKRIETTDNMKSAAAEMITLYGCKGIVLKGGHFKHDKSENTLTDIIAVSEGDRIAIYPYRHSYIDTSNTHGTGCSLSSAIAAHIATGYTPLMSAARSILWLNKAICAGKDYIMGHGHGPVNHMFLNTNPT